MYDLTFISVIANMEYIVDLWNGINEIFERKMYKEETEHGSNSLQFFLVFTGVWS